MAPPAYMRGLPSDLPDARNCVLKTKALSSRSDTDGKSLRLAAYSAETLRKAKAIKKSLCVSLCSANEAMSDTSDNVFGPKIPRVTIAQCQTQNDISTENPLDTVPTPLGEERDFKTSRCSAAFMSAINGLLDLTNKFLQCMKNYLLGLASDCLALLADGVSRAMRGHCVYTT